jgi:hypothetical protein
MSLIVKINPVPWKILELVKARILKNRAKQKKQGIDWSKDQMKQAMSLPPQPLLKRKKQEPSFVPDNTMLTKYTIEDHQRVATYWDLMPWYAYQTHDSWNIYAQKEGEEEKKLYRSNVGGLGAANDLSSTNFRWYMNGSGSYSGRHLKTIIYMSNFINIETGESLPPIFGIIIIGYYPPNGVEVADLTAIALGGSANGMVSFSHSTGPLWTWPNHESFGTILNPGILNNSNDPLPSPLYDITKLEMLPGYVDTVKVEYYE